jgi:hypothetical protein
MDAAVMLVGGINAMVVRAIEHGESNLDRLAPIAIGLARAALTTRSLHRVVLTSTIRLQWYS